MSWEYIRSKIENKSFLEIGGPSVLFNTGSELPLYDLSKNIKYLVDKVSFEESFKQTSTFENTYFGDATDIKTWENLNERFDVIISSHVIEHIANPLKFLIHVYNHCNSVITICPHYGFIWDCFRPLTSLEHMISDLKNDTSEYDLTHLKESYVPGHPWYEDEKEKHKFEQNFKYRAIHHHTFDVNSLAKLHETIGFKSMSYGFVEPHHVVYYGVK